MTLNIDYLPRPGSDNLLQSVGALNNVWLESLRYVDYVRTGPHLLSQGLQVALDNVRFHLATGVALIETYLGRAGGTKAAGDSAMNLTAFPSIARNYLRALAVAKREWNAWIDGRPFALGLGADPAAQPDPADAPVDPTTTVFDLTKSPSLGAALGMLGIGLGVVGLIRLAKG